MSSFNSHQAWGRREVPPAQVWPSQRFPFLHMRNVLLGSLTLRGGDDAADRYKGLHQRQQRRTCGLYGARVRKTERSERGGGGEVRKGGDDREGRD